MRARFLNLLFLALGAASCGGGDPASPGGNMGGGASNGGAPPLSASVTVQDYSYMPSAIRVKVGGTVTWSNHGYQAHTVTGSSPLTSGQLVGASGGVYGMSSAGGTYQTSFPTAGTYTYHCANHAQMTGTVTVVP